MADYFVICSGESRRQVQAVAEAIDKELTQIGCSPSSVEGMENAQWVLMDFNDLIVHVFKSDVRDFYGLDQLWGDAPKVRVSPSRLQRPDAVGSRRISRPRHQRRAVSEKPS